MHMAKCRPGLGWNDRPLMERTSVYSFPNDDKEQDRLDMLSHIVRLVTGDKLHQTPMPKPPSRILDIGTGTGIWAIEAGELRCSELMMGDRGS